MNTPFKTISCFKDNPFRTLGCFANDTKKTIEWNKSRIRQFSAVGKEIQFPSDLTSILGEITRSRDAVAKAEGQLTLPQDRIRYTQFWFVKLTPLDEIAFTRLGAGLINSAINIWSKKDYFASLHNKTIAYLIQDDIANAIDCAKLNYEVFWEKYIPLLGEEVNLSEEVLVKNFIDLCLGELGADPSVFREAQCQHVWLDYVGGQELGGLYDSLKKISDEMGSRGSDTIEKITANGNYFISKVRPILDRLKELGESDSQKYQLACDEAADYLLDLSNQLLTFAEPPNSADLDRMSVYYNRVSDTTAKGRKFSQIALELAHDPILRKKIQETIGVSDVTRDMALISSLADKYTDKEISDAGILFWNEVLPVINRIRSAQLSGSELRIGAISLAVSLAVGISAGEINKFQMILTSSLKSGDRAAIRNNAEKYRSMVRRNKDMLTKMLQLSDDLKPEVKNRITTGISTLNSEESSLNTLENRMSSVSANTNLTSGHGILNIIFWIVVIGVILKACT